MTEEQIIEAIARAMVPRHLGMHPDDPMPNDGPRWGYYAEMATAAFAVAKQHLAPQWQPIETAPKDGEKVLVGRFKRGCPWNGRIAVDWYRRPGDNAGFIGWGRFNPQNWPATHWMPLPSPPENGHD
jgi:hypothetical protein